MENNNYVRIDSEEVALGIAALGEAIENIVYGVYCLNSGEPFDADCLQPSAGKLARLKIILEGELKASKAS